MKQPKTNNLPRLAVSTINPNHVLPAYFLHLSSERSITIPFPLNFSFPISTKTPIHFFRQSFMSHYVSPDLQ
jgi:hypothetical protein